MLIIMMLLVASLMLLDDAANNNHNNDDEVQRGGFSSTYAQHSLSTNFNIQYPSNKCTTLFMSSTKMYLKTESNRI